MEYRQSLLDKIIGYVSPSAALARAKSTIILNQLSQLKTGRRGQRLNPTTQGNSDRIINTTDRATMRNLVRSMSYENKVLAGLLDRMVCHVVPHEGILPNAITSDNNFNDAAEEYYERRCIDSAIDTTGNFNAPEFQKMLLRSTFCDGDFLSVWTSNGLVQGVETDRVSTPQKYSSLEEGLFRQGVQIDALGKTLAYHVADLLHGIIVQNTFRSLSADACHFSLHRHRSTDYRGSSVFLPVLDDLRDLDDILTYEKFIMKMAACCGIKIKPGTVPSFGTIGNTPFASEQETTTDGKIQRITELYPGQIFDLSKMGASDVEFVENKRPGENFENTIKIFGMMIGAGISLPVELVLLRFHDGNMASARAALLEAQRIFFKHYSIVKAFSQWHYKRILVDGYIKGELDVPQALQNSQFWKAEWTEPHWNYIDPVNEITAEAMQIAFGFKTYDEVAKQRGKDWAKIAEKLGKEYQKFSDEKVPLVIGQPGSKTVQELMFPPEQNPNNKKAGV
jgi:lambda family phage portal protein